MQPSLDDDKRIKDLGDINDRLIVFGGAYSNLEATKALFLKAEALGVPADRIICTGDIVAYCALPEETSEFIRTQNIHCVRGNCEEAISREALDCGCGFETGSSCDALSAQWYRYTQENTSLKSKEWMGSLPANLSFTMKGLEFLVVHGGVSQINTFVFPSSDTKQKDLELSGAGVDVIIGGHSGIPFGEVLPSGFWLNAGVIGMPANDGTTDGWYMLLEPVKHGISVSWYRLSYDYHLAAEHMRQAGLNTAYAEALSAGLWPSFDILPDLERQQAGQALTITDLMLV